MLLNVVQIQTVAIILILSYFIGNFRLSYIPKDSCMTTCASTAAATPAPPT